MSTEWRKEKREGHTKVFFGVFRQTVEMNTLGPGSGIVLPPGSGIEHASC